MGVVSKTDANGNFIVEACGQPNMKMARHFLEWQRPEQWGKRRKRHVPHNAGVLVIGGDVTKKPEYDTTASVKARKWKSFSRKFRRQKPSFLENFRTTLSGPQHLPIAKNEEAKRHDRGTVSQNEAFVACAGFTSQQCLYPIEIREIGKELQLAGLELCRETFHEETP
jgi:hypothetical protein